MMSIRNTALALGALAATAIPLAIAAHRSATSDPFARAAELAKNHLTSGSLRGCVAIVSAHESTRTTVICAPATPHGEPIDGSTRFHIASLSKVFTRIAILRLAEQGRLALDDPLARHRPNLRADWAHDITLRQLLAFRSGLPRERSGAGDPIQAGVTLDNEGRALSFLDSLTDDGPTIQPGSRVLYSNLGYFHLGGVIEAVTGEDLEQALRDLVFEPAGMTSTTLGARDLPDAGRTAAGHAPDAQGRMTRVPPTPIERRYAAGGFLSTPDDLVALSTALINGGLLNQDSTALLLNEFGHDHDNTLRIAGLVPGFANVWSVSLEPPSALIVLNNAADSPNSTVAAHDEIAAALRQTRETPKHRAKNRESEGWAPLRDDADWPDLPITARARDFFRACATADADALFIEGLTIRGHDDEASIDKDSADIYRWMAGYQAALRDRYGPFELAWWRRGEHGKLEFLLEGPSGRALRYTLKPSGTDPSVTNTLSIATMGFDADPSLYEGISK